MSLTKPILNRFRVEGTIGEGAMGVVYRGADRETDLPVAIKVLNASLVDRNPELVRRFLREAEALRLLDHPNIVKLLDAGQDDRAYYLVMELVSGGSLRETIQREGQLTIERALKVGLALADALARAHHLDIIHRDVKPENILLAEDGTPRLTDFGVAKLGDAQSGGGTRLTQPGTFLGTIDYLSPEACSGESLDARTDIWAFAVVLFEMLTGVNPFTRPTIPATLTAILSLSPPDIRSLRSELPPDLSRLLASMLEKRPERRVGSARQVGAELERIVRALAGGSGLPAQGIPDTLLQTKLTIPPSRPNLVSRPRLIQKLNDAAARKLALISAPAGFGKTTLLSAWARQVHAPVAWLSLSADDDEPAQFLQYVISALGTVVPGVGAGALAVLQAMPSSPVQGALALLINELSRTPTPLFLLLDDLHVIESPETHDALAFLVDNMPDHLHIILSSRSDPPIPLSRLRVRGQLVELRQTELRFSPEEAGGFLRQSVGVELTPEQISKLEARTEGWIAGLQLAALSMRDKQDVSALIERFSGSHRFIIDYLADEVLAQQPEALRRFMEQTSILDRFSAPLCDKVTGRDDSAAVLKSLEESNAFLMPLDDHRQWYRYHQLFRDFLRLRLDEENEAALHGRASEWLLFHGHQAQGVKHALDSGDLERAVSAVAGAAAGVFNRGSMNVLTGWLNALSETKVLAHPDLAIYRAFLLFLSSGTEEVRPYLEAAEEKISADSSDSIRGRLMSLKAHLFLTEGKTEQCVQLSRDALEYLQEDDMAIRNFTFNLLGQVLEMKGDVAGAAEIYRQAFRSGWKEGERVGAMVVLTNLIISLNELGRRKEALRWCDQLLAELDATPDQGLPLAELMCLPRSLLSLEGNDLDQAWLEARRSLEVLTAINVSHGILWAKYILARVHLARAEYEAARPLIQDGEHLAEQVGRAAIHGAWFAAIEAQIDLEQGNLDRAVRWAEKAGYAADDTPNHWQEQPYFTFARLLLAQHRLTEARTLLDYMEASAGEGGRARKLITVYLLQARLFLAEDDPVNAQTQVNRALSLASAAGYRRAFLDEGQTLVHLLRQARETSPVFVDELLTASYPEASSQKKQVFPKKLHLVESLTERELDVLRLVVNGMSNREVAAVLVVTLGTVKKHLNNIFGKLGVKSRTQAAIRARELNLLE